MNITKKNYTLLDLLFPLSLTIFIFGIFLGADWLNLMDNVRCFKILGCNAGFFGFDAVRHFFSGITIALGALWCAEKGFFTKKALTIFCAICMFIVIWEGGEFIHDYVRTEFFQQNLFIPNHLDQPSVADTVGDFVTTIAGAVIVLSTVRFHK